MSRTIEQMSPLEVKLEVSRRGDPGEILAMDTIERRHREIKAKAQADRVGAVAKSSRGMIVQERNVGQAPIFKSKPDQVVGKPSSLHGAPIRQVQGNTLAMRDSRDFARIATAWLKHCQLP